MISLWNPNLKQGIKFLAIDVIYSSEFKDNYSLTIVLKYVVYSNIMFVIALNKSGEETFNDFIFHFFNCGIVASAMQCFKKRCKDMKILTSWVRIPQWYVGDDPSDESADPSDETVYKYI
jgi:hypothetical protein